MSQTSEKKSEKNKNQKTDVYIEKEKKYIKNLFCLSLTVLLKNYFFNFIL